ncbi:MAG TPA: hypothetical protein VNJ04_19715 [Gemmatimonadaceae bacterium]|nr:hypothetical protein [Gemmatimonadaceae bacterium]
MPRSDRVQPPRLRTPPALPRGPKLYREPKNRGYVGGSATPPPGFLGATVSAYEWMIYHAIAKVIGQPEDPRLPPFIGFPGSWVYQKAFDQGRREAGGAVIDFVVYAGNRTAVDTAFRIQTEYFHVFADAAKQAADTVQFARLAQFFRVVDIYDQDFAWDVTNAAACAIIRRALSGDIESDPISTGMAQRVRPNRS